MTITQSDLKTDRIPRYFEGECTCDHFEDEHGWGCCGLPGCGCAAGWTEGGRDEFEPDVRGR